MNMMKYHRNIFLRMLPWLQSGSIISVLAKKGILRDKREFWIVLEQVEKLMSDAVDITTSVREMPNVK